MKLAPKGKSWSEKQLADNAKNQGVYILVRGRQILYVGKTDGPSMTFGVRLRREFQESAAQGKHVYKKLTQPSTDAEISVAFLPTSEVQELVQCEGFCLNHQGKIAILEQALIQSYQPEFQIKSMKKSEASKQYPERRRKALAVLKKRYVKEFAQIMEELNRK